MVARCVPQSRLAAGGNQYDGYHAATIVRLLGIDGGGTTT